MKAYKFEFRQSQIANPLGGKTEAPVTFSYLQTLKEALTIPSGQNGLTTEELLQSVLITGKVEEAEQLGKGYVLLDDKQAEYVKTKVNNFRWSFAHKALAEFVMYVRELPQAEVDVKR
jgi:hypothetical protein